jgi:predicted DsbA family dithiol-disulfide isomerase
LLWVAVASVVIVGVAVVGIARRPASSRVAAIAAATPDPPRLQLRPPALLGPRPAAKGILVLPGRDALPDEVARALRSGDVSVRGRPDAPVALVALLDFANPLSANVFRTATEIAAAHPDDVQLVVRPVPALPVGVRPAEAVLAAREQGRFWEMAERILRDPDRIDRAALETHARDVGLDVARFAQALDDRRFKTAVEREVALARSAGAHSPSLIVNRQVVSTSLPAVVIEGAVQEELARVRGVPIRELPARPAIDRRPREIEWPPPALSLPADVLGTPVSVPALPDTPVRGDRAAKVEVRCFVAYEGPETDRTRVILEGLARTHGAVARIAVRPVTDHGAGQLAAEAAWAAAAQGKFWELHDAMLAQGPPLDGVVLGRLASEVGLDPKTFRAALDDHRHTARVESDTALRRAARLNERPSCVVDGVLAREPLALVLLVEAALVRAGVPVPEGTRSAVVTDFRAQGYDLGRLAAWATLGQLFRAEARDTAWARATEEELGRFGDEVRRALPGVENLTFECRTTLCRISWRSEENVTMSLQRLLQQRYRPRAGGTDAGGLVVAMRKPGT